MDRRRSTFRSPTREAGGASRDARRSEARVLPLLFLALSLQSAATASPALAQGGPGTENGEWRYIGGDAWHTRYSPLDQIDAQNFEDLELAWLWRGDNYAPYPEATSRSTPVYVDGVLYTVAGSTRQVVAIDPATGETLWTFREPHTTRHDRSMRAAYGKGVAYADVPGRGGVVFISTPGFFLWALDAETGRPLEDWGEPIPIDGFPETGGRRPRGGSDRGLGSLAGMAGAR